MARSVTTLQVLVAYPDDVAEEREILDGVVSELNITWSQTLGLQLEIIDWKTHSWPNFGTDAQAVINEELGDEYDIFLGIMWMRFGEPTPRAGSGTAEEFNRALERFKNTPNQLRIMFYFKDAPPNSLREVDPTQLTLIREFKERVDHEGGLYAEFKNAEQFATSVRMHLSKQAQDWGKTWGLASGQSPEPPKQATVIANKSDQADDDEEGFLDLIERSQESFETLAEILVRMSGDMDTYTKRVQERNKEMKELNEQNADLKQRKRVINSTADIMDQYSGLLETEAPRFSTAYLSAVGAMTKAISIWSEDQMEGREEAKAAYEVLNNLTTSTKVYLESMVALRTTISGLPRATSLFNRSKRRMASALDGLIVEINRGLNLTEELTTYFENVLDERNISTDDGIQG